MLKITDCEFNNNGIAIAAPSGAAVDVEKTRFSENQIAVLEYASQGELSEAIGALGFKPGVPRHELRELLLTIKEASPDKREGILRSASLLQRARNFLVDGVDVAANILSLVNNPQLQLLLNALM